MSKSIPEKSVRIGEIELQRSDIKPSIDCVFPRIVFEHISGRFRMRIQQDMWGNWFGMIRVPQGSIIKTCSSASFERIVADLEDCMILAKAIDKAYTAALASGEVRQLKVPGDTW